MTDINININGTVFAISCYDDVTGREKWKRLKKLKPLINELISYGIFSKNIKYPGTIKMLSTILAPIKVQDYDEFKYNLYAFEQKCLHLRMSMGEYVRRRIIA